MGQAVVHHKTLWKLVAAIVAVVAAVWAVGAYYVWSGRSSLEHSVDALLATKLQSAYHIQKENLANTETDLAGTWWVRLENASTTGLASNLDSMFGRADDVELDYYKQVFQEELMPGIPLDRYELYKAELPLGDGTICETLPCNVEVLTKRGDQNLFVRISKN